jgi:MYXO-CTERM domain-containing protein
LDNQARTFAPNGLNSELGAMPFKSLLSAFALIGMIATQAVAGPPAGCIVCSCQDGAEICLPTALNMEVLEDQGVCGSPCASIGSSFAAIELLEVPCEDLPVCDHAEAPAASPLWLGAGALTLAMLGGLGIRRTRRRTNP